jgi:hypothetical protein
MTFFKSRWALAAAVVGWAGLIGLSAPAASASSHPPTAASSHPAVRVLRSGPGSEACAVKLAPLSRLPLPVARSVKAARPAVRFRTLPLRLVRLHPKGGVVICAGAGEITCAGAIHGARVLPSFLRFPALRLRPLEYVAGGPAIPARLRAVKVAFGHLPRLAPPACKSTM